MKNFIMDPDGNVRIGGFLIEGKEYRHCFRTLDKVVLDFLTNNYDRSKKEIAGGLIDGCIACPEMADKIANDILSAYLLRLIEFNEALYNERPKRRGFKWLIANTVHI